LKIKRKLWEELIAYFSLTRHGPHRIWRFQICFYCCVCIHCRGNVSTEPLLSNDMGMHIETNKLIRGIYEVRRWDDVHTKF
jgi:hypothetical protein